MDCAVLLEELKGATIEAGVNSSSLIIKKGITTSEGNEESSKRKIDEREFRMGHEGMRDT